MTAEKVAILKHEGQAALLAMGELVLNHPVRFIGTADKAKPVVTGSA